MHTKSQMWKLSLGYHLHVANTQVHTQVHVMDYAKQIHTL